MTAGENSPRAQAPYVAIESDKRTPIALEPRHSAFSSGQAGTIRCVRQRGTRRAY